MDNEQEVEGSVYSFYSTDVHSSDSDNTKAKKAEISQVTFEDMSDVIDPSRIGLKGSPTRVAKSYAPDIQKVGEIYEDLAPEEAVNKLMESLADKKLI